MRWILRISSSSKRQKCTGGQWIFAVIGLLLHGTLAQSVGIAGGTVARTRPCHTQMGQGQGGIHRNGAHFFQIRLWCRICFRICVYKAALLVLVVLALLILAFAMDFITQQPALGGVVGHTRLDATPTPTPSGPRCTVRTVYWGLSASANRIHCADDRRSKTIGSMTH